MQRPPSTGYFQGDSILHTYKNTWSLKAVTSCTNIIITPLVSTL